MGGNTAPLRSKVVAHEHFNWLGVNETGEKGLVGRVVVSNHKQLEEWRKEQVDRNAH